MKYNEYSKNISVANRNGVLTFNSNRPIRSYREGEVGVLNQGEFMTYGATKGSNYSYNVFLPNTNMQNNQQFVCNSVFGKNDPFPNVEKHCSVYYAFETDNMMFSNRLKQNASMSHDTWSSSLSDKISKMGNVRSFNGNTSKGPVVENDNGTIFTFS